MEYWGANRPPITAALAASQVSPISLLPFSEPTPFRLLEDRLANLKAPPLAAGRGFTFPHFQLKGRPGDASEIAAVRCHEDPGRSPDEASMSQGHARANSSSSPRQPIQANHLSSLESSNPSGANETHTSRSRRSLGHSPPHPDAAAPAVSASAEPEKPASSAVGLQHLLNPVAVDATERTSRRRNADHFDVPQKPYGGTSQMPSATTRASPGAVILPSITPPPISSYPDLAGSSSRRTLTPRTPSAYVPAPTAFNAPKGTIDAKKSPFGASRDLNSALGHEYLRRRENSVGAMGPGVGYHYVNPPAQSPPGRRASMGSIQRQPSAERRVSVGGMSQMQTSQSDSPSTPYSSYSHFSHTPPVPLPNLGGHPASTAGYFPPSYTVTGSTGGFAPSEAQHAKESYSPRTTSLGPNTYHLMTLNTEQGPIQVPVDVQAASKVADEKRKRNATASHRFRQRRKEKERETSQNIAKLEHQVRELAEEKDFYRLERDFFRSVVKNQPGQPPIGPRPTSPRLLRLGPPPGAAGAYSNAPWQGSEDGSHPARNTRRRTSSYVPPQGLAPPANIPPLPPGPPTGIPPAPTGHHMPMAPGSSGNGDAGNRTRLPGPVHLTVGPYDPSAPVHYENAWKPGP